MYGVHSANGAHLYPATQYVNQSLPLEVFRIRLVLQGIPVPREGICTIGILRLFDLPGGVVSKGTRIHEEQVWVA